MERKEYAITVDTSGLLCPQPVLKAKKALRTMAIGERLELVTTDPVAMIDIPHMCNQLKHTLVSTIRSDDKITFLIEKSS